MHPFTKLGALVILAACSGAPSGPELGASNTGGDAGSAHVGGDSGAASGGDAAQPKDGGGGSHDGSSAAAHAPLPQFHYGPSSGTTGTQAGPLLTAVEIVTVTWKLDTENLSAPLQAFGAAIAEGTWWSAVGSSYCIPGSTRCIGKGGTALAKQSGDFPSQPVTDSATAQTGSFRRFINDKSKAGDLPSPDANTLYVFYLPQGFTATVDGAPTCGYHGAANVTLPDASTINVPYVVVPRCTVPGKTSLEAAIFAASREIIAAATDPFLAQGSLGFSLSDPAWAPTGIEVSDYCAEADGSGQDAWKEGTYGVARIWSNASAAASHNPCVPIPSGEVFYGLAPEASTAAGITIAIGASATFEAVAFSDAPTSAWKIEATQLSTPSVTDVSFDTTSVNNGDSVKVTVTLKAKPANVLAGKAYERIALVSTGIDGRSHAWPIIVYAQ